MKTDKVKLSIITATYNSAKTLQKSIDSILDQPYKPYEYIVIDGASSDETVAILELNRPKFKRQKIRFQFITEKDNGIFDAWNKGLSLLQVDWVAFLNSDDSYNSDSLVHYATEIQNNSSCDFVTAKAKITSNGMLVREFGQGFKWDTFKREMKILHAGGFLSRGYIKDFGLFDISFKIAGDYEMLLRKGSELKVIFIDDFLVTMGADGVSSTSVTAAFKEARKAKIT